LIADNTVTLVKNVFIRPLQDFEFIIGHTYERRQAIDDRIKEISRDLAAINAANANLQKQIAAKEAEKLKVEEDLKFVKYEKAQLDTYAGQLTTQVRAMNTRLSELYRTNLALERDLNTVNTTLTTEINQRTEEAAAAAAGK
jgi:predicted nuclease with TOPRIM domain